MMFRFSTIYQRLLALVLPIFFVWGWAACALLCVETTKDHNDSNATQIVGTASENSLSRGHTIECCQMQNLGAVLRQERQVVTVSPFSASFPISSLSVRLVRWSAQLPEIRQNSPPEISLTRLFERLCSFRI
jgi:hypothetical protein